MSLLDAVEAAVIEDQEKLETALALENARKPFKDFVARLSTEIDALNAELSAIGEDRRFFVETWENPNDYPYNDCALDVKCKLNEEHVIASGVARAEFSSKEQTFMVGGSAPISKENINAVIEPVEGAIIKKLPEIVLHRLQTQRLNEAQRIETQSKAAAETAAEYHREHPRPEHS